MKYVGAKKLHIGWKLHFARPFQLFFRSKPFYNFSIQLVFLITNHNCKYLVTHAKYF